MLRASVIPTWTALLIACALFGCDDAAARDALGRITSDDFAIAEAGAPAQLDAAVEPEVSNGIACFRHLQAICERSAECRRLPAVAEGCLELASDCPATFFVPGSTRTNEGLLSCAPEYADFDCERFLRGESPKCATPGTLPGGAECEGHMACASTYCGEDATGIRTCYSAGESGGVCDERTECPPGEDCSRGRCSPITELTLQSGNAPQSDVGGPCLATSYCMEGLYCAFVDSPSEGACATPPKVGEACASESFAAGSNTVCDAESYCDDTGLCAKLPSLGQACAERPDGKLPVCIHGSYCDATRGLCTGVEALGAKCSLPKARTATSGLPVGAECDFDAGLRCICDSGEARCGVDEGTCRRGRVPGESCDGEFDACLYGSRCSSGLCDYP